MCPLELDLSGKLLNEEEIVEFVKNYKEDISTKKTGRYYNLIDFVPSGQFGLDYGCGWGAFSKLMEEKGNRIIGQDLIANEVGIARRVWGDTEALKFTNEPITSFEDGVFDFVTSCQVIEHTHNPGMYLSSINRVLKENGALLISVPNIINPRYIFPLLNRNLEKNLVALSKSMMESYSKKRDHILGWDPVHFTRLLASVGFEVEQYRPTEGVPMPQKLSKYKVPLYIYPTGSIRQLSYTMIFKAIKKKNVMTGVND